MTDGAYITPDRANRNSFSIESYLFLFIQLLPTTVHCPPDLMVQDSVRYIHFLQQQGEGQNLQNQSRSKPLNQKVDVSIQSIKERHHDKMTKMENEMRWTHSWRGGSRKSHWRGENISSYWRWGGERIKVLLFHLDLFRVCSQRKSLFGFQKSDFLFATC